MKISELATEIRRRNGLLYHLGMAHLILAFVCIVLMVVDHRQVTNLNAWIKPLKFALSIFIYVWTFAWLLEYLPQRRYVNWISWTVAVTMIVEMVLIVLQAARGVPSHFNIKTPFDGIVFAVMGMFIGINTIANLVTLILFFGPRVKLEKNEQIAWQFGLLLLFLGSISGGMMVGRLAHTVGAPDGGPGLPFVNWSTAAGDIRAAHFITLHGLQFIPLIWWLISERWKLSRSQGTLIIVGLSYLLFCIGLHALALRGIPVVRI